MTIGRALLDPRQSTIVEMTELQQELKSAASLISTHNINRNGLFDRVKLMVSAKTFICGIEKCGITTAEHVAQLVNGDETFEWYQSSPQKHNVSFDAYLALLNNSLWQSVIIYRDPIVRFISAYNSKCLLRDSDGRRNCHDVFRLSASHISLEAVAARLPKYGYSNPHWIPQSHFCGGTVRSAWDSYTHHIPLNNLSSQVIDLLRDRVKEETLTSIKSYLKQAQMSNRKHVTHAERTSISSTLRYQLVDFYWEDYRLFLAKNVMHLL
mmetsp:Transcript_4917/g.8283  ORF Transcript_4917/g.8283 Transcript_4917/m.8283 type:complete len:267 (+) Transcript_4917:213-1013(+)